MSYRFQWQFPADHPALAGHFPGEPIAPGAVLLDRLDLFSRRVPEFAGGPRRLEQVKFLRACRPGDKLTFVLDATDDGGVAFRVERDATVLAKGVLAGNRPGSK
jgi:3-hydroxymyristoyl/3-hydroxydecanoyl-(acyl carrier protein) dehydratase